MTILDYKEDSIEINIIESKRRKTRKYFEYEKESYIKRFYRVK